MKQPLGTTYEVQGRRRDREEPVHDYWMVIGIGHATVEEASRVIEQTRNTAWEYRVVMVQRTVAVNEWWFEKTEEESK